jgi:hypothetical protein
MIEDIFEIVNYFIMNNKMDETQCGRIKGLSACEQAVALLMAAINCRIRCE